MRYFKRGRLSIACVCMVLGFMLAVQFRSTQDIKASVPYQRVEELTARLQQTEKDKNTLQAELDDIKSRAGAEQNSKIGEDLRLAAGLTALEGPGVIVTIDDSKKSAKADEDLNLYLIHDEDLLKVVNELRAAGAEAISINGQRMTATSELRCAGPTLSVNNVRSAPPYEIRAIGETKTLENALKMRGGVAETLKVWGISLDIRTSDNVLIPAYKGSTQFKYAKATDRQEETP